MKVETPSIRTPLESGQCLTIPAKQPLKVGDFTNRDAASCLNDRGGFYCYINVQCLFDLRFSVYAG